MKTALRFTQQQCTQIVDSVFQFDVSVGYFEFFLTGLQDYWELLNIFENKYEIHTEDN